VQLELDTSPRAGKLYSEPTFYSNFLTNMYPTTKQRSSSARPVENPITEDDRINQQMAMLLMKSDGGPSPDAASATFRIDLPEDHEEQRRQANSQELLGSPPRAHAEFNRPTRTLTEEERFERWDRGRTTTRPLSIQDSLSSQNSRAVSRDERRREIELGMAGGPPRV
jgi:hypothetical protein